jgi:hypothetical protein
MICTARTSAGKPCKGQAVSGATVCRVHGGKAPQVQRAAVRNLTIARAQRMVELSGVDMDPIAHLLDSLHRAATLVNVWGVMIAALDAAGQEWADQTGELRGSLNYGEPSYQDAERGAVLRVTSNEPLLGFSQSGEARMHPFVAEYNNALERRAKFAKMCLDAGVSERQIALAERMGEQLSMLWERTMNAIDGLTEAQRLQAAKAYAREIALLERPVIDGAARDVA